MKGPLDYDFNLCNVALDRWGSQGLNLREAQRRRRAVSGAFQTDRAEAETHCA